MPSRFSSEGTRDDAREVSENLGVDFREIPIEAVVDGVRRGARASFAGREPDLTEENLQARDPRHAADGALEQVRLARRLDREQVGDGGRLRDALRRHGRRLRAAQGRLQDGRLPARPPPERARRARADPGDDDRAAADAPSFAPSSATTSRCRRTSCSTRCSRRTSSSTARARSCSQSSTAATVERALALVDRAEYKRRQAAPGVKLRPRAFGRDWRLPITNRWRG